VSLWSAVPAAPADRRAEWLDLLACGIALALILLVAVNFWPDLRLVLTLLFTCFVPGRAVVTNWPRVARWSGIGMSAAFSLGILTLLATVTLWAGLWHPLGLFVVEAVISLAGLANGIVRRRQLAADALRAREPDDPPPIWSGDEDREAGARRRALAGRNP
jgi:uncharacterized membrane protein HdeD (DUF308 family)